MRKISKYQLFTELQHGPVTRIYKAIQPELQRVVLMKQLNPELINDVELVERFKQEGLILAKINSPHVITIFDFGFDNDVPFLVTEFIEGNTLAEMIQQHGALPFDIGLFILQQLAYGLIAIHNQNIIHQDIKPGNIFVSTEGEVKLGDLGFSVPLDHRDQHIQGTPAYLAPEIVEGLPADFQSDLYSLGLVGYEMLTGENPFAADEVSTILNRVVSLKPISVHAVRTEVPEKFSLLIAKLTARNPDERFQTAKELSRELEELKISSGIKVDGNSLINFLQNPNHYQISQIIPQERLEQPIQKSKRGKRTVLAVGLITFGLIIFFMIKLMDLNFSFSSGKKDTTQTAIEPNLSQLKNQNDIPIDSNENSNKPEAYNSKENSRKSTLRKDVIADTLNIFNTIMDKLDTIVVTSDPKAFVFHQEDSLGITPISLVLDSKQETVEIEFRTPGFPGIRKTVTIVDQAAQKIHINLWKEVGYLDINIIPWGQIWIDGDSIDISPISHPIVLAPGNHRLMIRHPSLKKVIEPFYIAVGETLRKTIQLQRIH